MPGLLRSRRLLAAAGFLDGQAADWLVLVREQNLEVGSLLFCGLHGLNADKAGIVSEAGRDDLSVVLVVGGEMDAARRCHFPVQ